MTRIRIRLAVASGLAAALMLGLFAPSHSHMLLARQLADTSCNAYYVPVFGYVQLSAVDNGGSFTFNGRLNDQPNHGPVTVDVMVTNWLFFTNSVATDTASVDDSPTYLGDNRDWISSTIVPYSTLGMNHKGDSSDVYLRFSGDGWSNTTCSVHVTDNIDEAADSSAPIQSPPSQQSNGCTLSGREVDSSDQSPLQGMRMDVLETGQEAYSDGDGRWSFSLPSSGVYTVVSHLDGYTPKAEHYVIDSTCAISQKAIDLNLYSYGPAQGLSSPPPVQAPPPSPPPPPVPAITVPAAPSSVQLVALGPSTLYITWTPNSSNETGFDISRDQHFAPEGHVAGGTYSYVWDGLPAGSYICISVRAVNSAGASNYSNWGCLTLPSSVPHATVPVVPAPTASAPRVTLPAAPSNVQVTAIVTGGTVVVSWQRNSTNEDGFDITDDQHFPPGGHAPAGATSYAWTGLPAHTYFCFSVRAFNSAGASNYSAWSCLTTP